MPSRTTDAARDSNLFFIEKLRRGTVFLRKRAYSKAGRMMPTFRRQGWFHGRDRAQRAVRVRRAFAQTGCCLSGNLFPEGGVARGEQRVFAGVPAKEVIGLGMRGMVLTRFPDFVKQVGRGPVGGTVEIVAQAAVFFACGTDEGAEFRFEKNVLPLAGAQDDQQRRGVLGQLAGFAGTVAALAARTGPPGFLLGHDGGDCTPTEGNSKRQRDGWRRLKCVLGSSRRQKDGTAMLCPYEERVYLSGSLRPAFRLSKFITVF